MRLGFDVHGVIDTFGVFQDLVTKLLEDDDVEIHVISGLASAEIDDLIGHLIDLSRITNYFSIVDHLVAKPDVEVTWVDGLPWADEDAWDRAKAEYCLEAGIDVLFDDSPTYVKYFDSIPTIYCQIHNPDRKRYYTR